MRPAKASCNFLLGCLLVSSGVAGVCPRPGDIHSLYGKAYACFTSAHPTAGTDSMALALFDKVIGEAVEGNTDDLLANACLNKGILLDIKGNYVEALAAYSGALQCAMRHREWGDTLRFRVLVYAGTDHYRLDNFDSAATVLGRAEALDNPGLPERDRLYNALGALNYEGGNYLQGKDYFIKALDITRQERPGDRVSRNNFQSNIASCLYKLKDYKGALAMYRGLPGSEQVFQNMGQCFREMGDYRDALAYYRKIRPAALPGVYNELANVHFLMGDEDSAFFYLDKKVDHRTTVDGGINALYRAQLLMAKRQHIEALRYLQQAIISFSRSFQDLDVHKNPTSFTGVFASYRLFDALSYKANTLESLYNQTANGEYLEEALSAYNSAILLFRYIEKTYVTDDAKLFLKRNNKDLYENAFLTCLELDRLHPGGPYLERAFMTAEESKASIVSGQLVGNMPGVNTALLRQLRDLKRHIAKLGSENDQPQRVNYEIQLAALEREMEQNSTYYHQKFEDVGPTVRELQSGLSDRQCIVSLFVSREGLHEFVVTARGFHCLFVDSLGSLTDQVRDYLDLLGNTSQGSRFGNKALTESLYRRLVKPLLNVVKGKDEWTIIPDGIFYRFPFEALPLEEPGHYLLEQATIAYQLSTRFLLGPFRGSRDKDDTYKVLAFAPFADRGAESPGGQYMNRLTGSGPETWGLPGERFINEYATKARFLEELPRYRVIHLATHTAEGGLVFFPAGAADDCLFLPEIYGLNLDSTDLVILSACESGNGQIEENEGLMSLSRAFMYAGCASTVNSLWKADDRSTALILKQFHFYLEKGWSKSDALRQAKLDFIHSNAVYVSPNYWAHLVLVGNTDAIVEKKIAYTPIWLLAGLGVVCLVIWRLRSGGRARLAPSLSGEKDARGPS